MVEPLKELNQICQKPRYKEVGNWMVRHVLRDAALPVTWLLLHTKISANQVTLFSLVVGIAGVYFISCQGLGAFLIGVVLIQVWYFLDHVDGQVARYRKTSCLSGRFFDFVTHHIIHGVLFFGLGYYVYGVTDSVLAILAGFFTSFCMILFNLVNDVKAKTFLEKILSSKSVTVKQKESVFQKEQSSSIAFPRRVYSFLHKISEIHVLMNILTVAALLNYFVLQTIGLRVFLFVCYFFVAPFLAITKITYLIVRKKLDEEFEGLLQTSEV